MVVPADRSPIISASSFSSRLCPSGVSVTILRRRSRGSSRATTTRCPGLRNECHSLSAATLRDAEDWAMPSRSDSSRTDSPSRRAIVRNARAYWIGMSGSSSRNASSTSIRRSTTAAASPARPSSAPAAPSAHGSAVDRSALRVTEASPPRCPAGGRVDHMPTAEPKDHFSTLDRPREPSVRACPSGVLNKEFSTAWQVDEYTHDDPGSYGGGTGSDHVPRRRSPGRNGGEANDCRSSKT